MVKVVESETSWSACSRRSWNLSELRSRPCLEDMKKAVDGQHRLAGDRVESLLPVQGEKVDMWYDVQNVREVSESKDRS